MTTLITAAKETGGLNNQALNNPDYSCPRNRWLVEKGSGNESKRS